MTVAIVLRHVSGGAYKPTNTSLGCRSLSTYLMHTDSCSTPVQSCVPSTITANGLDSLFITDTILFSTAFVSISNISFWQSGDIKFVVRCSQLLSAGISLLRSLSKEYKFPDSSSCPRNARPCPAKYLHDENNADRASLASRCCFWSCFDIWPSTCFNLLQLANSVAVCVGLLVKTESFYGLLPIFEPNGHKSRFRF